MKENLITGSLVDLVDYCNAKVSKRYISSTIKSTWNCKGVNATKERISIMCTAATQGQGKTELCRQLTLNHTQLSDDLPEVSKIIAIPISFNQYTTFSEDEVHEPVQRCLTWRILYAFGNKLAACEAYTYNLRTLFHAIRERNCPSRSATKSVGIFLLVDEILMVRDNNAVFFKNVLDMLTDLQQQELREGLPTFLLITSLELLPVSKVLITGSGRRIAPIPMPFFADMDLEIVAKKIHDHILDVLRVDCQPDSLLCLERFQNLNVLVRVAVSISGRHFRTLEDAVKSIYRRLVSREQHDKAAKRD